MDQLDISPANCMPRDAGWTPHRRARFLECLAEKADVRRACARVELSRQSAYKLRRRDPEFARAWIEALELAREAAIRRLVAALPERTRRTLSNPSDVSTWRAWLADYAQSTGAVPHPLPVP